MSIQTALQFIKQVRVDATLRQEIAALGSATSGDEVTLERLVQVAAAAGFNFTAEELQSAHMHDWAMRWAHYQPVKTTNRSLDDNP